MKEYHLAAEMSFDADGPTPTDEQFEAFLDEMCDQLDAIDREVHLTARLRDRVASFGMTYEADSYEEAANQLLADMRTALHAAGCPTPGWPRFEPKRRSLRELEDA